MTIREQCPRAQRKQGSPTLFCEDGSYCAHQYLCPATRRYENSGWRACRRTTETNSAPEVNQEVKQDVNFPVEVNKKVKESINGAKKVNKRRPRKG